MGLCPILHKPTINLNKRQTNQECTSFIKKLSPVSSTHISDCGPMVGQTTICEKKNALQNVDCKCMLSLASYSCIHCYETLCTIQVVSEVNLQISRVILLGNEQLDQEHFLPCQYNLVGKLNNVSLQSVKEQSCSLFHFPDNRRSFPLSFQWLPSFYFPPTKDKKTWKLNVSVLAISYMINVIFHRIAGYIH